MFVICDKSWINQMSHGKESVDQASKVCRISLCGDCYTIFCRICISAVWSDNPSAGFAGTSLCRAED